MQSSEVDELDKLFARLVDADDLTALCQVTQRVQGRLDLWRQLTPPDQRGPIVVKMLAESPQSRYLMVWRRELAKAVAHYNGCQALRGVMPKNILWLVGREDSVGWARKLYLHLAARVEGFSQLCRPQKADLPDGQKWPNWVRSCHSQWRGLCVAKLTSALELGSLVSRKAFGDAQKFDDSLDQEIKLVKKWSKQNLILPRRSRNSTLKNGSVK